MGSAASVAVKTSAGDTTNTDVYTTASVTVAANRVVRLSVFSARESAVNQAPAVPTIAGTLGLTWTQIETQVQNNWRITTFWAPTGAGATGTITITHAVVILGAAHSVEEVTGADIDAPVVQKAKNGAAGTSVTATLPGAVESADNFVFATAGCQENEAQTAEAGFTELTDLGFNAPTSRLQTAWRDATDDASYTNSSVTSAPRAAIMEEWRAAPIRLAILDSGVSTTNATSRDSNTIAPAANRRIIAVIESTSTVNPSTPTASGLGLPWAQVRTQSFNQVVGVNRNRVTVFEADSGDTAPTPGVVTFGFDGQTQTNFGWSIFEVDDFGNVDPPEVKQSAQNSAAAATSLAVTLAAFVDWKSATIGVFGADTTAGTTPGTGFEEIHDVAQAGEATEENLSLQTEWKAENDTSVDASKAANADWGGIALEIGPAAGGGQTISVTQAVETDTGQPVAASKTAAVGQASEADTAQPITAIKTAAISQATETDTAQPVAAAKTVVVSQAAETDTADTVAAQRTVTVAQATETDTAFAVTVVQGGQIIAVGQAVETDTAFAVAASKAAAMGQAVETDTGQTVVVNRAIPVGFAIEADTVSAVAARRAVQIGLAAETDTAFAVTVIGGAAPTRFVVELTGNYAPATDLNGSLDRVVELTGNLGD